MSPRAWQMIVGWFAVVVGLLLAVHNVFAIRELLGPKADAGDYVQAGFRAGMVVVGAVLAYFGWRRLGRRTGRDKS